MSVPGSYHEDFINPGDRDLTLGQAYTLAQHVNEACQLNNPALAFDAVILGLAAVRSARQPNSDTALPYIPLPKAIHTQVEALLSRLPDVEITDAYNGIAGGYRQIIKDSKAAADYRRRKKKH